VRARATRAPHLSGSPTMAYFVCGSQFLAWPFPGGVTGDAGTVQVGVIESHHLEEKAHPPLRGAPINWQASGHDFASRWGTTY